MTHDQSPSALRHKYSRHEWTPISIGCSGDTVHRLEGPGNLYVKVSATRGQLDAEADRLRWLGIAGLPVPEVVEYGTQDDYSWLVTTEVPGRSAAAAWPSDQREKVIDALADITQILHGLNIEDCPYDRSLAVTMPAAIRASGQTGTSLQLLDSSYATFPHDEDLVVCHGDLCLPNVIINPTKSTVAGLIDVGRLGRADRYADLAVTSRSIESTQNPQFGPEHSARYLARCGVQPIDTDRVTFYRLLDQYS